MARTTNRSPSVVASRASARCRPCHWLTTHASSGAKHASTATARRFRPVQKLWLRATAQNPLTAVSAHDRLSTSPRLHAAKPPTSAPLRPGNRLASSPRHCDNASRSVMAPGPPVVFCSSTGSPIPPCRIFLSLLAPAQTYPRKTPRPPLHAVERG